MKPLDVASILSLAESLHSRYGCSIAPLVLAIINFCRGNLNLAPVVPFLVGILNASASDLYTKPPDQRRMSLREIVTAVRSLLEKRSTSKNHLRASSSRPIAKHLLHFVAELCYLAVASQQAALDLRTEWRLVVDEVFKFCGEHDRKYLLAALAPKAKMVIKELLENDVV